MEESTKAKLVDVVKNMNARGISSRDIRENLSQMGLQQADIDEIIQEANPPVNVADIHDHTTEAKKMLENGEHLQPVIEQLGEHRENFERVHSNVNELHTKHDDLYEKLDEIAAMKQDLEEIKAQISEIKPLVAATKRLQENLVELNKKVLLNESSEKD